MAAFLQSDFNYETAKSGRSLKFPEYNKDYSDAILALYLKYQDELIFLSEILIPIRKKIRNTLGGYPGFCDIEAEFLYILIREIKPSTVFEISSRHGFTTNFVAAALSKNGSGQLECFEITKSVNGVPTEEIIRSNISDNFRDIPVNIHIGDARIMASEQVKSITPDFLIIDSLHTDVFSEYYINVLFKYTVGGVYIQDINHYGPRPEWASEAYYTLNHLIHHENNYLPISLYEDDINDSGCRSEITSHRAFRSSSIFFNLQLQETKNPDIVDKLLNLFERDKNNIKQENLSLFPLNSVDLDLVSNIDDFSEFDEDSYFSITYKSFSRNSSVNHAGLISLLQRKFSPDSSYLNNLTNKFRDSDPFHRVLILYALANSGRCDDAVELYNTKGLDCETSGLDVNVTLANVLFKCGQHGDSRRLLKKCRAQGEDVKLTGASTQLFMAAALASRLGDQSLSRSLIDTAFRYVKHHDEGGVEQKGKLKLARTLFRISFRRPQMLLLAIGSGFHNLGMIGGFADFVRYDLLPRLHRTVS